MPDSFSFMQGSPLYTSGRLSFSRPVPTADPLGARISENIPRFGRPASLAGLPGATEIIDSNLPPGSTLMHIGLDRDGVTPIAVLAESGTRTLRIYRQSSSGASSHLKLLRTIVMPTDAGFGAGDILGTIFPGCPVDSLCFDPTTLLVIHGTLIALCRVSRKLAPSSWQIQGVGVAYSTDLGQTWVRYWTDVDDPRNLGRVRLAGWEMTNYYVPYNTSGKTPLDVVVPFTDYRLAGTPNPSIGGRICWFQMSRASSSAPLVPLWGPAGVGSAENRMACFTLDTNPADSRYCHAHAAGVVEYQPQGQKPGWQVIAALGDGAASSMLRIIVKDPSRYWLRTLPGGIDNWTIKANFHGHADSAVINETTVGPGTGEHQNFDTTTGMQFVGCGPGPSPGTLLLGSDGVGEGIMVCTPGDDPLSRPAFQSVQSDLGSVAKSNSFYLRVDRPELPTRTVTCGKRISPYNGGHSFRGEVDVIWFSRDSGRVGSWGCMTYAGIDERYSLLNDSIYSTMFGGTKLVRIPLPASRQGRPLLLGPGGNQWLRDDPTRINISGFQVIRCPRDSQGRWLYPSADGQSTLGVIDPQPPVMTDAVFRVRKKVEDASGGVIMTVSGSQTNPRTGSQLLEHARLDPNSPPQDLPRPMWLRAFIRNTPNNLDLSAYEAGRSPAAFDLATAYDGVPRGLSDMYLIAQDTWEAVVTALESSVGTGEWFTFICKSRARSSDTDGLIAFSEFITDSYRGPGYPLPPDQPECWPEPPPDFPGWGCMPVPTHFPDELSQLNNLGLGGTWTLLLAGICADDSWDQFTVTDPTDQQHSLFSLLTSSPNGPRITLRAITRADQTFQPGLAICYQIAPGANELRRMITPASFFRGRPLLLALTGHSASATLTLTAAVGGTLFPKLTIKTPAVASIFDLLTFSGPEGQGSVSAFQWAGLRTESRVLSDAEILAQFRTLDFIPA